MIYCIKCGQEMPDDALFCPSCGTPVAKTKKSKKANTSEKSEAVNQGGTMINVNRVYGKIDIEKLPQGYEIDKRYKVIEKLGQGSFGAVYKVYDKDMETEKALKIIPETVINDKEAMLSLRKEAAIMVKLNHKNIVRVYDFHHNGDIKYIDMEYVEGGSLADIKLTKPDKKFTEEEVKEYTIQVLEGLSYAHKKKIIHKDIKPQNLMLDKSGKIKIMDFGIAETVHSSMSRLKNTGSSGTLIYMSPEQLQGKDVGREADIYSLGASMYELLSGQPPFHQGDITYQIINKKPEKIKGISYQMNYIIQKCLKKDMKDRYLNCEEFKEALKDKKIIEKLPQKEIIEENKNNEEKQEEEIIKTVEIKPKQKKKNYIWIILLFLILLIIAGSKIYLDYAEKQRIEKQRIEQQRIEQQRIRQQRKEVLKEGFVFVKGGTFKMGSNNGDSDEKPVHTVTVDDFYIGKYEVTQKQWKEIMGSNPSYFKGDNLPVENVSWNDVQDFIKKLNRKTGKHYRLPTEAEWEYAARGGVETIHESSQTKYAGSNNIDNVAWYSSNSGSKTHAVGTKQANELGIYDMSGNVWEWCSDWYDKGYYKNSPHNNPQGASSGKYRVLRGGSWNNYTGGCRVAYRYGYDPATTSSYLGFRLVR